MMTAREIWAGVLGFLIALFVFGTIEFIQDRLEEKSKASQQTIRRVPPVPIPPPPPKGWIEKMADAVVHPSHYNTGKIEVIDFITDQKLNFCRGNAVKYICRAGRKDPAKEIEDLEKAVFYLNDEIRRMKESLQSGSVK